MNNPRRLLLERKEAIEAEINDVIRKIINTEKDLSSYKKYIEQRKIEVTEIDEALEKLA